MHHWIWPSCLLKVPDGDTRFSVKGRNLTCLHIYIFINIFISSNYPSGHNPLTCLEMEHYLKSCKMQNRKDRKSAGRKIRTEINHIGFTLLHEIRPPISVVQKCSKHSGLLRKLRKEKLQSSGIGTDGACLRWSFLISVLSFGSQGIIRKKTWTQEI